MQDALLPRPPEGMAPGAALALLVHLGLLAALTLAVDWHATAPETVSAELWASLPQVAAPREVAPPPPPAPTPAPAPAPKPAPPPPPPQAAQRDADIATERAERRQKEQQERLEQQEREREKARQKQLALEQEREKEREKQQAVEKERLAKAAAAEERKKREAADAKAEEQRLAKLREEQMKRMLGSLQANAASPGTASADAAPSASYLAKLKAAIGRPTFATEGLEGNPETEVELRMTATGTVFVTNILKPSGVKAWDDAVLRQIERAGTLPRDTNGKVPSRIVIVFRPKE